MAPEPDDPTRIPYTLSVQTVAPADRGTWIYRVEYLEIADSVVEDRDLLSALHRLEAIREKSPERTP